MKKLLSLVAILLISVICLSSCGDMYGGPSEPDSDGSYVKSPSGTLEDMADSVTIGSPAALRSYKAGKSDSVENASPIQAGQLTCGEHNDNRHYDYWLTLFSKGVENQSAKGLFEEYVNNNWSLNTHNRVIVNVANEQNQPIGNATVVITDASQKVLFRAVTNMAGVAYLFPDTFEQDASYVITAKKDDVVNSFSGQIAEDVDITLTGVSADRPTTIDMMFVIDTTGSMGDELLYLQAEIEDIINKIHTVYNNVTVRLALTFYRDTQDEYLTRHYPFTEVNSSTALKSQLDNLSSQVASGGGDYEEAVEVALDKSLQDDAGWSGTEDSLKLMFFVLDAPPHDGDRIVSAYSNAVKKAAGMGVRIIPIASSGVDTKCQYLFRSKAMFTNGTYIYLTGHSGIGNAHETPDVNVMVVEYLNACMLRIVDEMYTGEVVIPLSISDPIRKLATQNCVTLRGIAVDEADQLVVANTIITSAEQLQTLYDSIDSSLSDASEALSTMLSTVIPYNDLIFGQSNSLVMIAIDIPNDYLLEFATITGEGGVLTVTLKKIIVEQDDTVTRQSPQEVAILLFGVANQVVNGATQVEIDIVD